MSRSEFLTPSQELEGSALGLNEQEGLKPLPSVKWMSSAKRSCTNIGLVSLVMGTSEPSLQTDSAGMELSPMLFAADSLAKTSAPRESAQASPANGLAYGANTLGSLASYDPDTSSWRTSQRSLEGGWTEFSETWPRSGMTRSGIAYQLQPLALCTRETVFGSPLIPTPTACDFKGSGLPRAERGPNKNLRDWFKWFFGLQYPPVTVVEYMMGFPAGYTDCMPLEMPSSPRSRKSSGGRSSKRKEG